MSSAYLGLSKNFLFEKYIWANADSTFCPYENNMSFSAFAANLFIAINVITFLASISLLLTGTSNFFKRRALRGRFNDWGHGRGGGGGSKWRRSVWGSLSER